ncbi:hypothetical protein L2K70_13770 [Nocardioides KLBMP 9356]|uniref:Uncharacterized protein n=1 Tax=Nocardioides potassii TaxID=2911371 RepID=A0ABS9HEE1_9ACTN|nr:hypothetical protein [Nocardioides potassii]MCF6378676.1 hypothetical protein [Nocardioides potassii]
MAVDRGLLATLKAQTGKGDELGAFLERGRELAAQEQGTVTWYAFDADPEIVPVDVLAAK